MFTALACLGQKRGSDKVYTPICCSIVREESQFWFDLLPISIFQYAVAASRHLGAGDMSVYKPKNLDDLLTIYVTRRYSMLEDSQRRDHSKRGVQKEMVQTKRPDESRPNKVATT